MRVLGTSSDDKRLLGDVYSVCFSLAIPGHRSTMHKALWDLVDGGLEVLHVPPDPAWARMKRAVLSHTFYRFDQHVKGELTGMMEHVPNKDYKEIERMVLQYLNGDPRNKKFTHHCNGCCGSIAECKRNVYAALMTAGFLLGSDVDLPASNKWGSITSALARVVGAMFFHRVLMQVTEKAFPTWDCGASREIGDAADDYRLFCKRKVFRMKKILHDDDKVMAWSILSLSAEPLDHLWMRLQYLDARGRILLECSGDGSPFREAMQALSGLLTTPVMDGAMAPVFWFFEGSQILTARSRKLVLNMAAQTWWRFGVFEQYPFKLVQMVDPAHPDPAMAAQDFWDCPQCCKSPHFCRKVMRLFESSRQLLDDKEFNLLLRNWSAKTKLTNMHIERLLALIKRGIPGANRRVGPDGFALFCCHGSAMIAVKGA